MRLVTQINDNSPGDSSAVARKLAELDVVVTNQHLDEFMYAPLQDAWERYEMVVELLSSIGHSSFHTVVNKDGHVSAEMCTQILQAMRHERPIVFTELPDFADDVPTFARRIISTRLHMFTISNLHLHPAKTLAALRRLSHPAPYGLTEHDDVLIRAHMRAYLRSLVGPEPAKALVSL